MKTNHCKNCIAYQGTSCVSKVPCPVNSSGAKSILPAIFLMFVASASVCQQPEIGYLVTIQHLDTRKQTEVHRLTDLAAVDSLVNRTFSKAISWFDAKEMLEETRFFEIISERKSLYCEKKRIVGRKKNGELKLRNLKRWQL